MFLQSEIKMIFFAGLSPVPDLTCPDTLELSGARSFRRSRHGSIHNSSYGVQSSPAFNRICPASVCRITASGILVQYAG
jgi:hypothetical protein